jgi:hypothetical protein
MRHVPSPSRLAAIAVVAVLVALPAWAEPATKQDAPPTGQLTTPDRPTTRELDALIVTGATEDKDGQRWADDSKSKVPEIADSDWVAEAN